MSRFLDKWRQAQGRRADEIIAEQRERAKQREAERKAKEVDADICLDPARLRELESAIHPD